MVDDRFIRRLRLFGVALAAFMAVAVVAVGILASRSEHAVFRAQRAASFATRADRIALAADIKVQLQQDALRAEAVGQCFRVAYLRYQIDQVWYRDYLRDTAAARLLLRAHSIATRRAARSFQAAATAVRFLPQTDCAQAINDPTRYRPPAAEPMGRSLRRAAAQRPPVFTY